MIGEGRRGWGGDTRDGEGGREVVGKVLSTVAFPSSGKGRARSLL